MPADPKGVVIFAHGGGSSRTSPRNRLVARMLYKEGFATLLVDLLGREEREKDKTIFEYRFNIALLSERLAYVTKWVNDNQVTLGLAIGLFGTSTGAAAALTATATAPGANIKAVVSRGGRPDLVKKESLHAIEAPTLFIVGGKDKSVISWTVESLKLMARTKAKEMVLIRGAGHLFEEPGSIEQVAELAASWFKKFLAPLK
jgi:putative phosphoribosyl transferase